MNLILSPDKKWLAQPLIDGSATNLWLLNAADGAMRRVTDFSDRAVIIARRVTWSRDGRFTCAAIADIDADTSCSEICSHRARCPDAFPAGLPAAKLAIQPDNS